MYDYHGDYGMWALVRRIMYSAIFWWLAAVCTVVLSLWIGPQSPWFFVSVGSILWFMLSTAIWRTVVAYRAWRDAQDCEQRTDVPPGPNRDPTHVEPVPPPRRELTIKQYQTIKAIWQVCGRYVTPSLVAWVQEFETAAEPAKEIAAWTKIALAYRRYVFERFQGLAQSQATYAEVVSLLVLTSVTPAHEIVAAFRARGMSQADAELLWDCYKHPGRRS